MEVVGPVAFPVDLPSIYFSRLFSQIERSKARPFSSKDRRLGPFHGPFHIWWQNPIGIALNKADVDKFLILSKSVTDSELQKLDYLQNSLLTSYFGMPNSIDYKENIINIVSILKSRGVLTESSNGSALANAIFAGNKDLFDFLLYFGAKVDHFPKDSIYFQNNPLFASIIYYQNWENFIENRPESAEYLANQCDFLKALLDAGAMINIVFKKHVHSFYPNIIYGGFSPLTYSAKHQLNDVVSLLIAYGADVDLIDDFNNTPLISAIEVNNIDGVKLLLAAGASLKKIGAEGKTPIDTAYSMQNWDIFNLLINAEANSFD